MTKIILFNKKINQSLVIQNMKNKIIRLLFISPILLNTLGTQKTN